jgi:ABC-type transport system substrate-binding protein
MVTRVSQVALVGAASIALAPIACDSPARVKPWRHAPDPIAEAAHVPSSPALADLGDSEVRAAHAHTLRIQLDAEPVRLNPLISPTTWGRRITLGTVFEPLIRYLPPEAGQPAGRYAPRLARSWAVVTPPWGGLELRLELEPGATFHDGHPLTSVDVQFTLDAIRDTRQHGMEHLRAALEDVSAVELIAPTQVRLVLKRQSGWVMRALAEIPILPMHVYKDSLKADGALIGSGPWKVASTKGGVVHLTRYDRYWGGKAAIADVEFVYQPDAALALKEARRGELDIIPALIPAHYPDQATSEGILAAFAPLELKPPRFRLIAFNPAHAPLDDPRVRHAIALLVDRKEISECCIGRRSRAALWPIWPGGLVHGVEPAIPAFDPKAKDAGALLEAAGWVDTDKDGLRDHNGQPLRLTLIGLERDKPKDLTMPMQRLPRDRFIESARKAGVALDLKTYSETTLQKKIDEGKYDLVELAWTGMADMDASRWLRGMSPRIDKVLDQMAGVWDPGERTKLAGELAAAFAEAWPFVGVAAEAPQGLISRRVDLSRVRPWDGWIDLTQLSFQ